MKKILAMIFLMCTISIGLQAKEVSFDFSVLSSGAMFYPCNVGLSHSVQSSQDYYNVSYNKYEGYAFTGAADLTTETHTAAAANTTAALFDDTARWDREIEKFSIKLGSENYGAEYFIEFCSRGSQIPYVTDEVQLPTYLYSYLTITDQVNPATLSYAQLAKPSVSIKYGCTYQDNSIASLPADWFSADLTPPATMSLNNDLISPQLFDNSNTIGNTRGDSLLNGNIPPQFCVIRFEVKESSVSERKWERHGAVFSAHAEIYNEDSTAPDDN